MKYKFWILGLLVFIISFFIDKALIAFIANNRILGLNNIVTKFAILTNGFFSLIVIGLAILIWKRGYIYRYLTGFGVFTGLIWLIKYIVQRPRPLLGLDIASLIPDKAGFSFPSGHAGFAFFSLAFVWELFPKFKWIWLDIAILISLARLYTGVHYISDILGGMLLGLFIGMTFLEQKFFKFKQ